jgi:hypothetical protein
MWACNDQHQLRAELNALDLAASDQVIHAAEAEAHQFRPASFFPAILLRRRADLRLFPLRTLYRNVAQDWLGILTLNLAGRARYLVWVRRLGRLTEARSPR